MTPLVVGLLLAAPGDAAFERHVRPVLVEHCHACHGPKKQMGGLRLDSREALLKGTDLDRLVSAIRHDGDLKMPPKKKLPQPAIDALTAWAKAGAPWPSSEPVKLDREAWRRHWAFRPVRRPPVPGGPTGANPIDRFIGEKLSAKGLNLSPEADRRTLIRRLSYDLLGLPPRPEDVDDFLSDRRPDAYERLVDRLLASPRHGERWARHWLDVARYADTKGYVFFEEPDYPWGWTYRDYVIEAFNGDLPYDRFVVEQLAADRLDLGNDKRPLRALGFLALGGRFMNNVHDILDDRIDVVTRGLMGLTVSCARCHDHKFDPVPTADYYALYGVFASTQEPTVPPLFLEPPTTPVYAAFVKELAKREKALAEFVGGKFAALKKGARTRAAEYLLAAHARRGQPRGDDFMLLADGNDINPTMLIRWQSYLERTAKTPHRVWGPWHTFASTPESDFAATAARVVNDPKVNSLVAAMFACPPTSLAEVAQRYGKLLGEIGPPLDDADYEEVRQVLDGPNVAANLQPGEISNLELLPDRPAQAILQKLQKDVEQWRAKGKGAPPRANVLLDLPQPVEPVVFRRGNPNSPGERVARRLPTLLSGEPLGHGSGRLELARAIADPNNPLTARVMVNRVWMHHFGQGLVATPGDFGLRADAPSHPELLDWLAAEFVSSGWSMKHLHRLIVTSATYRQLSGTEDVLLARYPRCHLDLESLRDTLLVVADQLDSTIGGPSAKDAMSPGARRRTLYSWVDRLHVPGLFRAFDFPSPDASSPKRDRTMVPQQALFLMNSPFALQAARSMASRKDGTDTTSALPRIKRMYRLSYGRDPDSEEIVQSMAFLNQDKSSDAQWHRLAQALLLSNEFTFVD